MVGRVERDQVPRQGPRRIVAVTKIRRLSVPSFALSVRNRLARRGISSNHGMPFRVFSAGGLGESAHDDRLAAAYEQLQSPSSSASRSGSLPASFGDVRRGVHRIVERSPTAFVDKFRDVRDQCEVDRGEVGADARGHRQFVPQFDRLRGTPCTRVCCCRQSWSGRNFRIRCL